MNYDVGVIGGGVIGLACAWRLAQAGARVALFERGQIGREASHAAAGMLAAQCEAAHHPPTEDGALSPQAAAMFELCLHSRALYAALADELLDATGVDVELSLHGHKITDWREPGILYIARHGDAAPGAFARQKEQGQRIATATHPAAEQAIWLPDEGQVENRKLIKALRLAAERAGVTIFQHEAKRISRLFDTQWRPDRVNLDISLGKVCDKVLLCAGAWSNEAGHLPDHCQVPVRPVAGQMLALRTRKTIKSILYSSDVYLVPRRDGRLLVGATMEEAGFHKRVTAGGVQRLLSAACELLPDLGDCAIEEQWAGLRPATPDGLPILGRTPLDNLFVATGHFRNGILLTPATAALMRDCILHGQEVPPAFGIERFQKRHDND